MMLQVSQRVTRVFRTRGFQETLLFSRPTAHKHSMREEDYRARVRAMAVPPAKGPSTQPYVLGLTGSIAMGKSTVASMFKDQGVPVMDSDATVHELYAEGGAAVPVVQNLFPDVVQNGNEANMKHLEEAIHPLVANAREAFLQKSAEEDAALVVLDIPLLFEKGLQDAVDAVLVVSAPADVQEERALERPGMTKEKLQGILQKQVPDETKRAQASFIISTDKDINFTRIEVAEIIHQVIANCPRPA